MSVATLKKTVQINSSESLTRYSSGVLPIFSGLGDVLVSKKEILTILRVMGPTFSEWRAGQISVADCYLVQLTRLRALWTDKIEATQMLGELSLKAKLKVIHRCLSQQENINFTLLPQKGHDGSHRFRKWWFIEGEQSSITRKMAF
jgi:hypothetical protein